MDELLYKNEVYAIVGAAIDVHRELGFGYLEEVYQEALEIELEARGIPFRPQQELHIYYKGRQLRKKYRCDFYCYDKIIVEIRAIERLTSQDEAQLLNYLKTTKCELGVLINFGAKRKLDWIRRVRTQD